MHISDSSNRSASGVNDTNVIKNKMYSFIEDLKALKELNEIDIELPQLYQLPRKIQ